jgi:hypothetical protein
MPPEFGVVRAVVVGLDPESLTAVQPARRERLARVEKRRSVFAIRFGLTGLMPLPL